MIYIYAQKIFENFKNKIKSHFLFKRAVIRRENTTTTIDTATCGAVVAGINLDTICNKNTLAINMREMINTCRGVIRNIDWSS
jgi:hypothetical protein